MKYAIFIASALLFWTNTSAQTDFMPIGSTVLTEARAYGFFGSAVFNAEKDTLCNGAPCRKVKISYTNKISIRATGDYVMFFQQRGDSIFEYLSYSKESRFLFKNRHNVGDSFRIQETIGTTVVTRATVYIDSLILSNGVKRYGSRIVCRPITIDYAPITQRFNLYDKLIPDYDWNLYSICKAGYYDLFYYTPLCYNETPISYKTPYFTGSCDTIARLTPIKETYTNADLMIYPNPTTTFFNIASDQNQSATINIWNLNGTKLLQKMVFLSSSSSNSVDVQHLPNGLYFVSIRADNGFERMQKLIVHR